ncbi:putative cold-shock protein [Streptomyces ambofaciens ATCC 23877]|uniref:CSD domain-containing protein n=4 Tax=Streptomyces ambofaciens TaxID=1889 RepID=A0ABM6B9V0_STRAM|nr:cold shock domain-containing protein [Streptomyces ambofaciens]AKZ60455.1 putative cold-shock protein [Streptomyces ambofaciens ATCC 23877]ANB10662.1 hypothetical protein SAM40697_6709 [Streptomyces ambofaciens]
MASGTMNAERGFGFTSQDGGGPDVFVRYFSFSISGSGFRELSKGGQVFFDAAADPAVARLPATATV